MSNKLLWTDSYKIGHWYQYPPGLTTLHSYMEPRVGGKYKQIVWCGPQFILKTYGFDKPWATKEEYLQAEAFLNDHFGYALLNPAWLDIIELGYLPLRIRSVPEGTIVTPGTPVMSIENADKRFPWLTNYVESILLHSYAMTNAATISYACYQRIKTWCDYCGEAVSPFHLNDFGLRGASSLMSATMCGIGHLLVFSGTDNLPAVEGAMNIYSAPMSGFSVIAAEHSTITTWGMSKEYDAYHYILDNAPENATVSLVVDSYDWQTAITKYFCGDLKDLILKRSGTTVVRPDSGVPWLVTRQILQALWATYGGTTTPKGCKLLDPHIRIIYGDGISEDSIGMILAEVVKAGFSPNNVIFGMGGNLLQNHNRDTLRFAIKASCIVKDGEQIDVHKTTVGKESKPGRFDHLPIIYENGQIFETTFEEMQSRVGVRR